MAIICLMFFDGVSVSCVQVGQFALTSEGCYCSSLGQTKAREKREKRCLFPHLITVDKSYASKAQYRSKKRSNGAQKVLRRRWKESKAIKGEQLNNEDAQKLVG
jgi:hypothetical protein